MFKIYDATYQEISFRLYGEMKGAEIGLELFAYAALVHKKCG
jgi:hypothetical protein